MLDPTTDSFVSLLRDGGLTGEPCDEWSVRDLEQRLAVAFPKAYKAFLFIAGNGCEPLEGSHYAVEDDLVALQHTARRIMKHDRVDFLSDAFVFLVHQGYAFNFFLLQDGDDPAVHEYVEGCPPSRQIASRYSEWILNEVGRSQPSRNQRTGGG